MSDETPLTFNDNDFNVIVNLHPTNRTHLVLVIRDQQRCDTVDADEFHYFNSFRVETPPTL